MGLIVGHFDCRWSVVKVRDFYSQIFIEKEQDGCCGRVNVQIYWMEELLQQLHAERKIKLCDRYLQCCRSRRPVLQTWQEEAASCGSQVMLVDFSTNQWVITD